MCFVKYSFPPYPIYINCVTAESRLRPDMCYWEYLLCTQSPMFSSRLNDSTPCKAIHDRGLETTQSQGDLNKAGKWAERMVRVRSPKYQTSPPLLFCWMSPLNLRERQRLERHLWMAIWVWALTEIQVPRTKCECVNECAIIQNPESHSSFKR